MTCLVEPSGTVRSLSGQHQNPDRSGVGIGLADYYVIGPTALNLDLT